MKGARLIIVILTVWALAFAFIMTIFDVYPSWSQHALTDLHPLLPSAIGSMMAIFLIRSFTFVGKDYRLMNWFGMDIRVEHVNRFAGFMFFGILCTPVTHPAWWIQTLHMIFTGLAIGSCYVDIYFYYRNSRKLRQFGASAGIALGILGFLGGFIAQWYSIGLGELLAAMPIAVHVLNTNKQIRSLWISK